MDNIVGPDRGRLRALLCEYNEYPDRQERVTADIDRLFRRSLAILVVDSCGFSRAVQTVGIVHFLALLERLERLMLPVIERHGGRLLRAEADNFFAIFPDAPAAVACAEEIWRDVEIANDPLPAANEIYVAMGVGYGSVLVVGDDDLYGDEMNLACKLGEDLAGRGEVLLTEEAHAALGESSWQFEAAVFNVSGLELRAYRLIH